MGKDRKISEWEPDKTAKAVKSRKTNTKKKLTNQHCSHK